MWLRTISKYWVKCCPDCVIIVHIFVLHNRYLLHEDILLVAFVTQFMICIAIIDEKKNVIPSHFFENILFYHVRL